MITRLSEHAYIAREYASGRYQVEIARDLGLSQSQVCISVEKFCRALGYPVKHKHYGPHRAVIARAALNRYQGEFALPTENADPKFRYIYEHARHEHVWLLRAEGLTLQQIGDRIGVSRERVREIIAHFARRVQRATRRTRWRLT
jgi:DNA-binding CsgD family transcriptional regulator